MSFATRISPHFDLHRYLEEHEPDLTDMTVGQVMSQSLLTCSPRTPIRDLAQMMAHMGVQAVPIDADPGARPPRIVTATVLAQVACSAKDHTGLDASDIAVDAVTAAADDPLPTAAARMLEHDTTHLLVVDADSGRPVGLLSAAGIVSRWSWPV
jgi:CBS domain-containing protein